MGWDNFEGAVPFVQQDQSYLCVVLLQDQNDFWLFQIVLVWFKKQKFNDLKTVQYQLDIIEPEQ